MLTIELKPLQMALKAVEHAQAKNDSREYLKGVHFEAEGNELTLVATDVFRMAVCKMNLLVAQTARFTVPTNAVKRLLKLKGLSIEVDCTEAERLTFTTHDESFVCVSPPGFPQWRRVAPGWAPETAKPAGRFPADQMADAYKGLNYVAGKGGVKAYTDANGNAVLRPYKTKEGVLDAIALVCGIREPQPKGGHE